MFPTMGRGLPLVRPLEFPFFHEFSSFSSCPLGAAIRKSELNASKFQRAFLNARRLQERGGLTPVMVYSDTL